MPRYIDADLLAEMIQAKADTLIMGKEAFLYVAKWLDYLPAADVAPKSEVAREIFEKITNLLLSLVYLGANGKWHTRKKYANELNSVMENYLILHEKYIGEQKGGAE